MSEPNNAVGVHHALRKWVQRAALLILRDGHGPYASFVFHGKIFSVGDGKKPAGTAFVA